MSAALPSSKETLPLSVDNMGFMLDRLGLDCAPLQFLGELTQNSIEALLSEHRRRTEKFAGMSIGIALISWAMPSSSWRLSIPATE